MALKIAFAVPPLHDKGGVSIVVRDLSYGLRLAGIGVYIFPFGDTLSEESETVIPVLGETSGKQKKDFETKYKKLTNQVKIDAFFANSFLTHRLCREVGVANLFMVFHQGAFLKSSSFFELVKKIIYSKLVYDKQNIIGVSKGAVEEFVGRFKVSPKSTNYIYNAVDRKRIVPLSLEEGERMPDGDFILHAGRFNKIKRHDRLLRAFAKVRQNVKLLLLGAGEEEENIRRLIIELGLDGRVILLGWKENPFPYIKRAKVVVLTSDYEALPTVLIEAMMLNTPVVSVDCFCGPAEIMQGELAQYLVPLDNEKELASTIDRALISYPLIDEKCVEKFEPKYVCGQYIEIVERTRSNGFFFHGAFEVFGRIQLMLIRFFFRLTGR